MKCVRADSVRRRPASFSGPIPDRRPFDDLFAAEAADADAAILHGNHQPEAQVLVPEPVYQRLRNMLEDDEDILATGEMVDQIMAEDDANDPYLEEYQSYTRKDQK